MMQLLLGDEAVGLGAIHAGIAAAFSYPGTPATEIFEFIQRQGGFDGAAAAHWSPNEKVAYEQALGVSYAGCRSLVSMKHVGLNVAADPFINSALTGAHGGLVLAVADDPGMHSSQNEQDSRFYGHFARLPVLEPGCQQEAYDMTRDAFELSERLGLPVMIRLVTRLAHSRASVRTRPAAARQPRGRVLDRQAWTLLPANARRQYRHLLDLQPRLAELAEQSLHNTLELRGPRGIIAAGLGCNYVREVLGDGHRYSLLGVGQYPAPIGLLRRLVDHCDDVLVVEDGYPLIEDGLLGYLGMPGKSIRGRRSGALPRDGELTADAIRAALGEAPLPAQPALDNLPGRPPQLCAGCPHCDSFKAILDAAGGETVKPFVFSDIGCYTLSALPPYNAVDSCVDMGASIGMAHGAAKTGAWPVICTIGDSTFIHSGITPLIAAAYENADMTVFILDNAAVAMTGAQEVFATGESLVRLVRGLGVDPQHVLHVEPLKRNHDQLVALIRGEIEYHGLSVIVASRPCIHVKRRSNEPEQGAERPLAVVAPACSR